MWCIKKPLRTEAFYYSKNLELFKSLALHYKNYDWLLFNVNKFHISED